MVHAFFQASGLNYHISFSILVKKRRQETAGYKVYTLKKNFKRKPEVMHNMFIELFPSWVTREQYCNLWCLGLRIRNLATDLCQEPREASWLGLGIGCWSEGADGNWDIVCQYSRVHQSLEQNPLQHTQVMYMLYCPLWSAQFKAQQHTSDINCFSISDGRGLCCSSEDWTSAEVGFNIKM